METWQIVAIVLTALSVIIGGSAGIKVKIDAVRAEAARGFRELSEAFMASGLMTLKSSETLLKPDITVEDAKACWRELRNAADEWGDVFQWAAGIYQRFHPN